MIYSSEPSNPELNVFQLNAKIKIISETFHTFSPFLSLMVGIE
jgi:hypothetical protein